MWLTKLQLAIKMGILIKINDALMLTFLKMYFKEESVSVSGGCPEG